MHTTTDNRTKAKSSTPSPDAPDDLGGADGSDDFPAIPSFLRQGESIELRKPGNGQDVKASGPIFISNAGVAENGVVHTHEGYKLGGPFSAIPPFNANFKVGGYRGGAHCCYESLRPHRP